jgi:hypothetical protein
VTETGRRPMTRQRSQWEPFARWPGREELEAAGATFAGAWERRVGDGYLIAIVTINPPGAEKGWHLSISFRDHRGKLTRYPRWDEVADAREAFCPDDVVMAMLLPPADEYISLHDTTFQLHEVTVGEAGAVLG